MKKFLMTSALIAVLLSGCENSLDQKGDISEASLESNSENANTKIPNEIKNTYKQFHQSFVKENFEEISKSYSDQSLKRMNTNTKELSAWLKDNYSRHDIVVLKDFEFLTYIDYDKNHKYLEVRKNYTFDNSKKPTSEINKWMLIKEKNEWKFDPTLILKEEKLATKEVIGIANLVAFSDFTLEHRIDGKALSLNATNLSEDKGFLFNDQTDIILITSKGEYTAPIIEKEIVFTAISSGPLFFPFNWADGEPESVEIRNVYYIDENRKAIGQPFDISITLKP